MSKLASVADMASRFRRRLDGWVNTTTGLGGLDTDRAARLNYESEGIPTSATIDQIYSGDWLAERIIEKMPSIAMVRGFGIEGGEQADLLREFRGLNVTERFPQGAFQRGVYDGRGYGGARLLLGYALGRPETPLTPEDEKGGLLFLDVVKQHELKVISHNTDPQSPEFGLPSVYEILGVDGVPHPRRGQVFHASRSIRFAGRPLRGQQIVQELPQEHWVGVSVLTPVLRDIARYGTSWAAVSHLLQDASIGVMKISGLVDALASDDASIIQDRLSTLQRTKSLTRLLFLDAEAGEEFSRVAVSFADVPGVMAQIVLSISGAADMPAKILFGTSPMGLNANSAGMADLEQFYNSCDEYRCRELSPALEKVLRAVARGKDVRVKWEPLWQPSAAEQAQTRLTHANADKVYYDIGFKAEDIARAHKEGKRVEDIGTPEKIAPNPNGEGQPGADGNPAGGNQHNDPAAETKAE